MQKHVNLVDLVKSFPTNIFLQDLASIQKRTSPIKFAHLAEKSEKGSTSNLSTKAARGSASSWTGSTRTPPATRRRSRTTSRSRSARPSGRRLTTGSARRSWPRAPELKGSIGEGPNQTNYSDQSSVRILPKFRNFR